MKEPITVTPCIGYYVVSTTNRWGVQTEIVGKNKQCSCGGREQRRQCRHIIAVASYLKAGGERAPKKRTLIQVREHSPPSGVPPATCPYCDAPVDREAGGRWRCHKNPTHYFRWRGELNDGAIRRFLTQDHPAKTGAYYAMTPEERRAFLERATRRMHVGGYTPHS